MYMNMHKHMYMYMQTFFFFNTYMYTDMSGYNLFSPFGNFNLRVALYGLFWAMFLLRTQR